MIGAWLTEQRNAAGLTQKDLAARVGLSPQYLNDIERARRSVPPRSVLRQICDALGASYDEACVLAGRLPEDLIGPSSVEPLTAAFRAIRDGP